MEYPSFTSLERRKERGVLVASYAENLHPDPTMYKYAWWVFHDESPVEDSEYLRAEYSLSYSEAMKPIRELRESGRPCMVYNKKFPRRGGKLEAIVNHNHPRWTDREWAVAFEQDEDPEWYGHK